MAQYRSLRIGATFLAATFAGGAFSAAPAAPQPDQVPPNILVIYADDLGYGDLGSYGHHTLRTPTLDRLAQDGMRLTSYYAPSPLCSPSRASLLTGRTHYRTGIESWIPPDTDVQLGPREITIATLLKEKGYQTFMAGKWHLNGGLDRQDHTQPGDHGFDRWLALHAWPIPHNQNPVNFYRNGEPLGPMQGFTAQIVVDEAMEWLGQRTADTPFFMYLPLIEPHSTIANPSWVNQIYADLTSGQPDPIANTLDIPHNLAARGPGEYYANITYMDYQIGRLLRRIDRLGLRDNTFLFFASDNGPVTTDWRHWWEINLYGSTGGFRGRKADLYEGGIRVPAIVRWPGHVTPGSESNAPLIGYDLLPTLASLARFSVPDDRPIDGEDFSAVLRGEPFAREQPLYWEFDDDQGFHFALRDGNWKLLSDETLKDVRLYDFGDNRFEVVDVASERPEVLSELLVKLKTIRDDVAGDPLRPRLNSR